MSNLMERLLGGFYGWKKIRAKKQLQSSRRSHFRRRLGVEPMESRRLLATDFFGAVGGNVFTDLTDNGLDASDPGINGATVRLYQDVNLDGSLDAGDTLLDTQVTDADGNYLFSGLENGQYLVEQAAVSGLLQRETQTVQVAIVTQDEGTQTAVVDNLQTVTDPDPLVANPDNTVSDQQSAPSTEVIGEQRDVVITNDSSSGSNLQFDIAPSGLLIIDAGVATTGQVVITYDGVDNDPANIAHNLGNVDLTSNLGEALHFRAGSQAGSLLTVEVYSGSDQAASSLQMAIPSTAGGAAELDMFFCFSDFQQLAGASSPADFSNVSAIRVIADLAAADDIAVDFVGINGFSVEEINFANLNPMSLGDQVFNDANNNGVLDAGEQGISNVTVNLFEDTNQNGFYDDGVDLAVAGGTSVTDAGGNYLFEDLFPGDYLAVIPISELSAGESLDGFQSSSGNDPVPDPNDNVDDDDNGDLIVGVGIATRAISLASGAEPSGNGNFNSTLDFGFVAEVDLAITKEASSATVTAGNQLTYTINVSNVGQNSATNVVVVDDLPNLSPTNLNVVSITSASGNGVITQPGDPDGEIVITYASLAAGASDTITVVVEVPSSAAAETDVTNTVVVSADEAEQNEQNNQASVDVDIVRQAVLQITKTDSPDPVIIGNTLTYDVVVTNNGPSTATNVVVSDPLPAGLDFDSVTTTLGTASEAGGVVTANIPSLDVGQSVTVQITATVENSFSGTSIANSVTANSDEATTVTANANTTVNPEIDLSITKSDSDDPVDRGDQLIYVLDIENSGPSPATNVEVVDTLPVGVTFVSATGGTVTPPANGSRDVTIDLGTMAAGATRQVSITVSINNDAPETLTNTASVGSTETTNGFEPDLTNNTDDESTSVTPAIDLAIVKTDSADPVNAGNDLVYTLVITNNGPSTATDVSLTDTLPAGVTFTNVTTTQGSVSHNAGVVSGNLGSLAPQASATVTITVGVNPDASGTLNNTASVSANEDDINNENNSDSEATVIQRIADLEITKTGSRNEVTTGSSLVYTIDVTNMGPSTATSVVVTDMLPADVSFVSGTTSLGTLSNDGNEVTVNIGTLAPDASATITLTTTVVGSGIGDFSNTASVVGAEADPDESNNASTEVTELVTVGLSKRFLLASTPQ